MSLNRLLVTCLVFAGCGNNTTFFQPGGGTSHDMSIHFRDGGGGSGGSDAGGDGGGMMATIDMAGFNIPGSPTVVIVSPTSTTEVHYDTLTVTATVTSPTGAAIDASSVVVAITPPAGGIVTAQLSLGTTANTYSGSIDISAIPSGNSTFVVSAADIAGKKGSATGSYIHDHGPVITFLQPSAATAHGSVAVELMVQDTLHPITSASSISAYVHTPGDITLTAEPNTTPLRVQATIDFSKFNPPLDGQQLITATAVNSAGTKTSATKMFTVDNAGPVITFIVPQPGDFESGVVQVQATIDDISGVADASVVAVFANDPTHFALPLVRLMPGSDTFQGFFDIRSLGRSFVYPEVSISANDTLGNSSQLGEEIKVDNTPPKLTTDSNLYVYASKLDTTNDKRECSKPFSPLGPNTFDATTPPEAAFDGARVEQVFGIRARINDKGNSAPGQSQFWYAGLDYTSVFLFAVADDGMTPLAVDTDGDANHYCDNVNPLLVPSSSALVAGQALSLPLVSLPLGSGTADYEQYTGPGSPANVGTCDEYGDTGTVLPPPPLCKRGGTKLTVVVPTNDVSKNIASQIFSIAPVAADDSHCVGLQLDTLNTLPEGPTCIVAVATDNAGNTNVSPPIHVCIDRNGGKCAGWPTHTPPTTCYGTYDKKTMTATTSTPCVPDPTLQFTNGEVVPFDLIGP